MFEQAILPVENAERFAEAKAVLEGTFATQSVAAYLRRLKSASVRVRDFEGALRRGLLGPVLPQAYETLGNSDRGQVREMYLSLVEHVAPELRVKFLKLYAYY
jgi:hypothetical protein